MTTTAATQRDTQVVGERADAILEAVRADEDFDRLATSTGLHGYGGQ